MADSEHVFKYENGTFKNKNKNVKETFIKVQ